VQIKKAVNRLKTSPFTAFFDCLERFVCLNFDVGKFWSEYISGWKAAVWADVNLLWDMWNS